MTNEDELLLTVSFLDNYDDDEEGVRVRVRGFSFV